ncbi:MAG TPA: 2-C-methyl-D-erythritol 2,4-cyclodiphosphate synthase [Phycisphaerales bacterium]|nr:2-C-methyl-D-erythritol 2,4-cyclodiphosphate synthase [Phycisphaerales bacterium]
MVEVRQEIMRIGHGYDLHRLEDRPPAGRGRDLVVAGIRLDHDRGPISHSDGDVVLHAVTDAILGALGEPDIGQLFPDNARENEGRASHEFVTEARRRMEAAGYLVGNMDVTLICERPKVGPHKSQMRANIAHLLGCSAEKVNVKGKTHEKVDAVGEGRALECHVVALLTKA